MPVFSIRHLTDYISALLSYLLYRLFGSDYDIMDVLIMLACVVVTASLLSNLFPLPRPTNYREHARADALPPARPGIRTRPEHEPRFFQQRTQRATSWPASPPTYRSCSSASPTRCRWSSATPSSFCSTWSPCWPSPSSLSLLLGHLPARRGAADWDDSETPASFGQGGTGVVRRTDFGTRRIALGNESDKGIQCGNLFRPPLQRHQPQILRHLAAHRLPSATGLAHERIPRHRGGSRTAHLRRHPRHGRQGSMRAVSLPTSPYSPR